MKLLTAPYNSNGWVGILFEPDTGNDNEPLTIDCPDCVSGK